MCWCLAGIEADFAEWMKTVFQSAPGGQEGGVISEEQMGYDHTLPNGDVHMLQVLFCFVFIHRYKCW